MVKFFKIFIILLACQSCGDSGRFDHLSEQELHEMATKLSLQDRYGLYLKVYESRTPRNPVLASDIHALGKPARAYVIDKASHGDLAEIGAILSVVSLYNERCTPKEREMLVAGVLKISSGQETRQALIRRVDSACHLTKPF